MGKRVDKRLQAPVAVALDDDKADRVRRSHDQRIREIQALPFVGGKIIKDVQLEEGVDTPIPHGLGRRAVVFVSPPRGARGVNEIIVSAPNFQPVAEGNWFTPDGTADYWESAATTELMHIPVDGLRTRSRITGMGLRYFADGSANPTINFYRGNVSAGATLISPTVAWTNPGTATWETLTATYDQVVGQQNYYVTVSVPAIGDRIRALFVTVEDIHGAVSEVRSASFDPKKYVVLRADGWGDTVTVDVGVV